MSWIYCEIIILNYLLYFFLKKAIPSNDRSYACLKQHNTHIKLGKKKYIGKSNLRDSDVVLTTIDREVSLNQSLFIM